MKKRTTIVLVSWLLLVGTRPVQCSEPVAEWRSAGEGFSIDAIEPQTGWVVEKEVEASEWTPVAQPKLAEELEHIPELKLVNVAPPPERCWVGHRPYLVPNPDGESWDMAYPYYNASGFIWSFFDDTLVRIDSRHARVEAIGRLPGGARPAQLACVQGNLYLAGGAHVRRIEWPNRDEE
ncbi:MAG: hypothetical protein R6U98_02890 [Pirellulaceae bacterium]